MAVSPEQRDGFAQLQAVLREYGLESLTDWAWERVVAGDSPTTILQLLRETPEYRKRFRVIFERQRLGLAPMSASEVVAYERAARQMMVAAGLPPSFYDSQDDFEAFMIGDVSLVELSARVELARTYTFQTDPTTRSELTRLYGEGALVAHWLDPTRALPALQRQFQSGRLAGASVRTGFGALSREEAERLFELGTTVEQAEGAFGSLAASRELFLELPGELTGRISREEQLSAAFEGDAAARERIERRVRTRVAAFSGGGGVATNREGFGGLA